MNDINKVPDDFLDGWGDENDSPIKPTTINPEMPELQAATDETTVEPEEIQAYRLLGKNVALIADRKAMNDFCDEHETSKVHIFFMSDDECYLIPDPHKYLDEADLNDSFLMDLFEKNQDTDASQIFTVNSYVYSPAEGLKLAETHEESEEN